MGSSGNARRTSPRPVLAASISPNGESTGAYTTSARPSLAARPDRRSAAISCARVGLLVTARLAPEPAGDQLLVLGRIAAHAVTTFLNFDSPSWSDRRAASSEQPIASAMSRCARSPTQRRTTAMRCLSGSSCTAAQSASSGSAAGSLRRSSITAGSATGSALRAAGPVGVDRLAGRDRQHPCPQVRAVPELRVGAQSGDERLLEAVVRLDRADGRREEPPDLLGGWRPGTAGRGEGRRRRSGSR